MLVFLLLQGAARRRDIRVRLMWMRQAHLFVPVRCPFVCHAHMHWLLLLLPWRGRLRVQHCRRLLLQQLLQKLLLLEPPAEALLVLASVPALPLLQLRLNII
jgi:hypothetical protein